RGIHRRPAALTAVRRGRRHLLTRTRDTTRVSARHMRPANAITIIMSTTSAASASAWWWRLLPRMTRAMGRAPWAGAYRSTAPRGRAARVAVGRRLVSVQRDEEHGDEREQERERKGGQVGGPEDRRLHRGLQNESVAPRVPREGATMPQLAMPSATRVAMTTT